MTQVQRLFDTVYHQLENYPSDKMFVSKKFGQWQGMSTQEFVDEAMLISRGLIAYGIQKGDKVALVSANRYEWNLFDIAIQQTGAIVVPLYPNISENDYRYILNDANAVMAVVGTEELSQKIRHVEADVPALKNLFTLDEVADCDHWRKIQERAEEVEESAVRERMEVIKNDELATIIYTSGTTGNPKGVMLSHNNILSNVKSCIEPIPARHGDRVLTFLPVCHVYERMLHYLYIYLGCEIYFAESLDTIGENIREIKPHVFTAVPRLIEKVFEKIIAKGDELTGFKHKLFFWAVEVAEQYDVIGKGLFYKFKLAIANKLIFSKWREALGGNVRAIASGSAALQPRLARIFIAAKMPIFEGYGLTETSPVVSVNSLNRGIRIGTVGPLVDDVQVKFAEDGEILVKGPNVMLGYYNKPEATAEAIDEEGWFHTGDIGVMVEDKFLKITDRKKEIFKTSGGKFIVPQIMENKFKESRFIEQMMVVGEGEKFPGAFIVPSFEFIREWAKRHKFDLGSGTPHEIVSNLHVQARIQDEVDHYNKLFGHWEQIKKFVLLEKEFTIEDDLLTPTLKLKRKKIMERYQKEYKEIYSA